MDPQRKPKIGLALGSGAARGWAHIGLLNALVRAGIKVDVVCGTSVGAMVGGVYASGRLPILEEWVRSLSRLNLFRYADIKIAGGGLSGGDRLVALLDEHLSEVRIEQLSVPFAAIACDIATGHEIWLSRGPLVPAMRASFALPGLFGPVQLNGDWLVDGALVNPIPVTVCRALGADLVIAANLNADFIGRQRRRSGGRKTKAPETDVEKEWRSFASLGKGGRLRRRLLGPLFKSENDAPSVFSVMVASLAIIQDRLGRSRLAGDPPDVTIAPKIGHIAQFDFEKADELIAEGDAAATRALDEIHEAIDAIA